MTVAELRRALEGLPDDRLVVMSKDSEGNGFSPLAEVENETRYFADSEWSGECLHPDDWPDYPDAVAVTALWPTN